jgi:hypothetical protein
MGLTAHLDAEVIALLKFKSISFVVVVVEENTTALKSVAQTLLAVQVLQLQLITG